jgi:signal recognition particle subunit SRP54
MGGGLPNMDPAALEALGRKAAGGGMGGLPGLGGMGGLPKGLPGLPGSKK